VKNKEGSFDKAVDQNSPSFYWAIYAFNKTPPLCFFGQSTHITNPQPTPLTRRSKKWGAWTLKWRNVSFKMGKGEGELAPHFNFRFGGIEATAWTCSACSLALWSGSRAEILIINERRSSALTSCLLPTTTGRFTGRLSCIAANLTTHLTHLPIQVLARDVIRGEGADGVYATLPQKFIIQIFSL